MRSDRLTTVLVAALVLVLLSGGTTAYLVGRDRSRAAAEPKPQITTTVLTTASVGTPPPNSGDIEGAGSGASTPPTPQASPTPSTVESSPTSAVPEPSVPSAESIELPAPGSTDGDPAGSAAMTETTDVAIVGGATFDVEADEIRDLLQRYFDSINNRDYAAWVATVTSELSDELPEKRWLSEYGSTRDTDVNVVRIDRERDPFEVYITFRSRQDPKNSPDKKSTCLDWKVTHPLVESEHGLLFERSVESAAEFQPCSAG